MAFVDVVIATLKTNPCFESRVNVCYGVAMFRLLLIISCLGFVIGCGDESVSESTAAEPTVVEPTVMEPTAAEPTVMEPTVVEPTVVEPTVVEPRIWAGDATGDDLDELASGGYTEITGGLSIGEGRIGTIDLSQLETIGGGVQIYENPNLTTITMPQLQSIGGYFWVDYNNNLTTIDLPQLQSTGGNDFYIWNNSSLTDRRLSTTTIN